MIERDTPAVEPLALPESPELALPPAADAGITGSFSGLGKFLAGVGVFSLVQGLTQLLALGAGILWVRILPTGEYALYTLANSILALAAVLTDLGAGSALQHFFHRHQGERESFSRYLAAVRSLRRWLALLVLPVLLALLAVQARSIRLTAGLAAGLVILIVASSLVQQEATIRLAALRLLGRWRTVYRAEVALAAARFAAAAAALGAKLGSALLALTANLLASVFGTALATLERAPRPSGIAPERRAVLGYLAPIVPDTVYFALQGQLVVWLAALAGTTTQVAEVGALTRIGLLFAIPQSLASTYLIPKLAGRHGEEEFRSATVRYGLFVAVIAGAAMALAWAVPGPFLALLGPRYEGLEEGFRLVVVASALGVLGTFFAQVNRIRGWTKSLWAIISVTILGQAVYAASTPFATTTGVLRLGALASALLAAGHLLASLAGLRSRGTARAGGGR